mmetsp:Transcript_36597/g.61678  ORF Transcript_36597/g.61678 Transcript_36597/m.61678 type:complete len:204 (+) Transcript_36597:1139-1750(+)
MSVYFAFSSGADIALASAAVHPDLPACTSSASVDGRPRLPGESPASDFIALSASFSFWTLLGRPPLFLALFGVSSLAVSSATAGDPGGGGGFLAGRPRGFLASSVSSSSGRVMGALPFAFCCAPSSFFASFFDASRALRRLVGLCSSFSSSSSSSSSKSSSRTLNSNDDGSRVLAGEKFEGETLLPKSRLAILLEGGSSRAEL